MSQPEILHPCSWCGAAVREPAMFCPECGKPLAPALSQTEPPAEVSAAGLERSANAEPVTAQEAQTSPAPAPLPAPDPAAVAKRADSPDESGSPLGTRERTRQRLQRASTAARGALEDNVKRVEKIHHVSTVMFEEAHYDPSLRFVLVALGLFVVFIILLVLSKVMG